MSTGQLQALIRVLAEDTDVWADDTWLLDSTPVECGPVAAHCQAVQPGWLGRLRLLPASPDSSGGCDCIWWPPPPACRSRSRWRTRRRRTRRRYRPVRQRPDAARRPARSTHHRRQGLRQHRVRNTTRGQRCRAHPARSPQRAAMTRSTVLETTPPDHRIDQATLKGQRPRAPRRPQPTRRPHPSPSTTPRPHRRHLAQPPQRPTRTALPHRLRPLTPWTFPSS